MKLTESIDQTIIAVCDQVKMDRGFSGEYAERIKALAELIHAKAYLEQITVKAREGSLLSLPSYSQKRNLRTEALENQDNGPQITIGGESIENLIVGNQR